VSEVGRQTVQYPGGLAARYRWGGSGSGADVFALSESGGVLHDHGLLVADEPDRVCRAELRVEGPTGTWTTRFASHIYDEPAGVLWDSEALLAVRYGFAAYAIASRTGELRWWHRSGTPLVAIVASSRLPHLVVQSEVETFALDAAGAMRWHVAHADVISGAELLGGTLALTTYAGGVVALDPLSGSRQRS
jgi:hypothetical protein